MSVEILNSKNSVYNSKRTIRTHHIDKPTMKEKNDTK